MTQDPKRRNELRSAGLYMMIPAILLASPIVGFGLGVLLCNVTGAGDWLKALMAMLGMAAGANEVVKIIKKANAGQ